MAIEVIGAGFGRTGTLSLKHALEQLGFGRCYHMMEVTEAEVPVWHAAGRGELPNWPQLFGDCRSCVDWPACNFWRELCETYPKAKVVLTVRDPERWYDSVMNTIYKFSSIGRERGQDAVAKERLDMVFDVIWYPLFDDRMDDKAHVIGVFEAHNAEVRAGVPADRLLEYQVGSGWAPLCEFLDRPVPDTPFPRVNSTEEFTQMMGAMLDEGE